MNFETYITLQKRVNDLRASFNGKIRISSEGLRDTLLSEFLRSIRGETQMSVDQLEAIARDSFRITPKQSAGLRDVIESGMHALAEARSSVLSRAIGTVPDFAYEHIMAAHRVDFPSLSGDLRKTVVNAFRNMIADGKGVSDLRRKLEESQIVTHQASTLAQTSVAMFDNDYSISLSEEAGIKWIEYVGPAAQRQFCVDHLGKSYTKAQILKMDNGQGLPVITSGGGWRCQHGWVGNPFKK